jgi:energy-coupling factor transport system ATP-binding protein
MLESPMKVELRNISFTYPASTQPALTNLSFQINDGELMIIAGPNGAGKSTLLHLLNGILKPTAGDIYIHEINSRDTSTAELAHSVSVTFQNPADQIFAPTVRKEIAFGPKNLRLKNIEAVVDSTLALFQMQAIADKHPYDLLPAQRKLLTLASAVAMDTPILAFDEPTGGLSQNERAILTNVISHLRNQQRTLFIVTHDLDYFLPLADQVVYLNAGLKIFAGTPRIFSQELQNLRSRGILLPFSLRLRKFLHELP